ncbi:S-adenosylmethionine transporter [Phlyctochytrium arcticum]|nr:S-adenosylmethionine transporter [Phlyctochytrium arcticum]
MESTESVFTTTPIPLGYALVAGGLAGTSVDTALFPLDTIKTRLQSRQGFWASGGFGGIYSGLSSAVLGSAPGAAAFFVTYEYLKTHVGTLLPKEKHEPVVHMLSASGGEIAACFIRVPTEICKQRMQTGQYTSVTSAVHNIWRGEGLKGFYRGYAMTVFREIPFTCIQFPLYEKFKKMYTTYKSRRPHPWESAIFGSIAGGIAAALTTPLDVVKTRIMLSSQKGHTSGIIPTFQSIIKEEGPGKLFAGIGPRVLWISIGGSIFLGVYEAVKNLLVEGSVISHHSGRES